MPLSITGKHRAQLPEEETMTRSLAEILLFTSLAVNAALLIFIAGVLRAVMNNMDESAFKQFVVSLVSHSKKSPFMLTVCEPVPNAIVPDNGYSSGTEGADWTPTAPAGAPPNLEVSTYGLGLDPVSASSVALFGCDTYALGSEYSGTGTSFTGVQSGPLGS